PAGVGARCAGRWNWWVRALILSARKPLTAVVNRDLRKTCATAQPRSAQPIGAPPSADRSTMDSRPARGRSVVGGALPGPATAGRLLVPGVPRHPTHEAEP